MFSLFEKKKGGLLIIHEYTETEYKIFEKNGKDRKKLLERYYRKKKQPELNIMDYLKKYPEIVKDKQLEMLQNKVPKLDATTFKVWKP